MWPGSLLKLWSLPHFPCGRRRRDRGPLCRTGNRGDWDRHHRSQQPTRSARAAALGDFCDDVCRNSLIPFKNSLILKTFSLNSCLGNCLRSGCSAAVSWYEIVSLGPRIAKFPGKFPDTREFAWRLVRSALRRQPKFSQQN